jgi:hypothetical protein
MAGQTMGLVCSDNITIMMPTTEYNNCQLIIQHSWRDWGIV